MKRERSPHSGKHPPTSSLSVRFSSVTPSSLGNRICDRRAGRLRALQRPAMWLAAGILAVAALGMVLIHHIGSAKAAAIG